MLEINAEFVEAHEEKYTPDHSVIGIYFGEGDPEQGGQHWNFTQSISDDEDELVCVVKEIQQVVFYGNIDELSLSKNYLRCVFNDSIVKQTGTKELLINYSLSDQKWSNIYQMAQRVFENEPYFKNT